MADFARTLVLVVGGGSTRELHAPEDAAGEIAAGTLRRDTWLVVYEGGRGRSVRAGSLPELAPLFDAAGAAPSPAGLSHREAPSADRVSTAEDAPANAAKTGPTSQPSDPPQRPASSPPTPRARPQPPGGAVRLLVWLVAIGVAGWLLLQCSGLANGRAAYANRPTAVRAGPSPSARVLGELARGAEIRGAPDDGASGWLHITAGAARGGHVWRRNLSPDPRPELNGEDAPRTAPAAAPLLAEPDEGAAVVGRVAAGEPLRAVGVTRGGWAEVRLRGGGVGYLRPGR